MKHKALTLLFIILFPMVFCIMPVDAEYQSAPMLITSSTVIDKDLHFDDTAFVIKGDNICLDLGGHTITFNNGNTVKLLNTGFEDWVNGKPKYWEVLSGVPQKEKSIYFGAYDLVFPPGGGIIRSKSITLRGGKTYLAFAFVKSDLTTATADLKILRSSDGQVLAEWKNTNLARGYASKGTPQSDLKYKPDSDTQVMIQLECAGSSEFQVGMVDIKPAFDYGVVAYHYSDPSFIPDIPSKYLRFPFPVKVCIRNGTIVQGAGEGVRCAGIRSAGKDWEIKNVTIRMNGINTDGIYVSNATVNPTIIDNEIYSTSATAFNRMHGTAGIYLDAATGEIKIQGNFIDGVPQLGIGLFLTPTTYNRASFVIDGNTIWQRASVSNGYGILLYGGGQNFLIANNVISPYCGRGLLLDGSGYNAAYCNGYYNGVIRDNQFLNLFEKENFEYSGDQLECYGIRIRDTEGDAPRLQDIKISNNTISVYTNDKGVRHACGMNITAMAEGDSIEIYGNKIEATAEGDDRYASTITFLDTMMKKDSSLDIHNNLLVSNSAILRFGGSSGTNTEGIVISSNKFVRLDNPPPIGKPFVYGYWIGEERNNFLASNSGVDPEEISNVSFEGTGPKSLIIGKHQFKVSIKYMGKSISGAKVYLKDNTGLVLMEKETGPNGEVLFCSPEVLYWANKGDSYGTIYRREFSNDEEFTIEASKIGYKSTSMKFITNMPQLVLQFVEEVSSDQFDPGSL